MSQRRDRGNLRGGRGLLHQLQQLERAGRVGGVGQIVGDRAEVDDADQDSGLARFVGTHGQSLLRFAYLLTGGDGPAAEDLVYGVLERLAARGIDDLADPLPYVRRCIVNEQRSQGRQLRRHRESVRLLAVVGEDTVPGPSPEDRMMIMAALRDLGVRERAAIILRYFHDLPDERIAETLGCSRATVRSLVHRALPKLRQRLATDDVTHHDAGSEAPQEER